MHPASGRRPALCRRPASHGADSRGGPRCPTVASASSGHADPCNFSAHLGEPACWGLSSAGAGHWLTAGVALAPLGDLECRLWSRSQRTCFPAGFAASLLSFVFQVPPADEKARPSGRPVEHLRRACWVGGHLKAKATPGAGGRQVTLSSLPLLPWDPSCWEARGGLLAQKVPEGAPAVGGATTSPRPSPSGFCTRGGTWPWTGGAAIRGAGWDGLSAGCWGLAYDRRLCWESLDDASQLC